MVILPAIDLKEGRCVRLRQGDMATAVVYGDDPVDMARRWVDEGAEYLHVVDLDGAFAGRPVNAGAIRAICAAASIPVEVGGGIRDEATVSALLEGGVARVILGTIAYTDPGFVATLCERFPGKIAAGIDARDGEVVGKGWVEQSGLQATAVAETMARAGVSCVIYTDIARDGTETGPNVEATRALAKVLARHDVPVIASGGVGTLDDVARVASVAPDGVAGLIIGRALYTGAVTLAAAIATGRAAERPPREPG